MNQNNLSLVEHLSELRQRLIKALYFIGAGAIACWVYSEQIFEVVRRPIQPFLPETGLVYTGITDKFVAYLKISVMAGVILTTPFWLYQVWAFVAPALYKKEKKYAWGFLSSGSILFSCGALFVYFVVCPFAFRYLLHFGSDLDKPMITIDNYISFMLTMVLIFGTAFELPLILTVLGMLGVVDQKFLRSKRRFAIVILAIVSAVITPPDILSMMLLMIPLVVLYELSIISVGFFQKPS